MYLTSISLSYLFLGIAIATIAAYLYFKLLVIKSDPQNTDRKKIIGNMKDPVTWRDRNKGMSLVCLFWFIVSTIAFVVLKFFYPIALIPFMLLVIYVILMILSIVFFSRRKRKASI
jgi:Flp pilus assembly protein TadB